MIREFNSGDEQAILDIWLDASIIAHPFIEAQFWYSKVADMREIYLPASTTFVFEEQKTGALRGFVSLVENHIAAIFVHPNFQGMGIGKELISLAKQKYSRLLLCVYSKNKSAIEFYRKEGFNLIEEREEDNTGELEMVMEYNKIT